MVVGQIRPSIYLSAASAFEATLLVKVLFYKLALGLPTFLLVTLATLWLLTFLLATLRIKVSSRFPTRWHWICFERNWLRWKAESPMPGRDLPRLQKHFHFMLKGLWASLQIVPTIASCKERGFPKDIVPPPWPKILDTRSRIL